MKSFPLTTVLPATAIALGATAAASQPAQAYESYYRYHSYSEFDYDTQTYGRYQVDVPALRNAQPSAPGYHYAYYHVARPEYLL